MKFKIGFEPEDKNKLFEYWNEILDNNISFWLNWDIKTLINRIKDSKKRPIAFNNSKNELIKLIKKRYIVYSKAMYKIDCDNLAKNEIVKEVLNLYEAHKT